MSASNIERFDEITGEVFARLYASFPVPCLLKSADYVDHPTKYHEHLCCEVASEEGEFFFACIRWLESSGYITTGGQNEQFVAEALLTSKGLEVLRAVPASLQGKASIGERLGEVAAEGGREGMRSLVTEALGLGARLLGQQIGLT
ncbi:hypothetical protein D9M70_370340 [compost metagenome]